MNAENTVILLEARVEELQKKVNDLIAENTRLRESLLNSLSRDSLMLSEAYGGPTQ